MHSARVCTKYKTIFKAIFSGENLANGMLGGLGNFGCSSITILPSHVAAKVNQSVTVSPFIVVPGYKLDKCWTQCNTSLGIKYG